MAENFVVGPQNFCRACSGQIEALWELGSLALTGHFPYPGETIPEAPLSVGHCLNCSLVQLLHHYSSTTFFGENYGYRSGLNNSMVKHLKDLVASVETTIDIQDGDIVVDIGGNDGTTLSSYEKKVVKILVDPTADNWRPFIPSDVTVIPEFFGGPEQLDGRQAKLITTISMLYDLPSPRDFIRSIHQSLAEDGYWLCEQSDLAMMMDVNSFDTICHEHLEYYSRPVLLALAAAEGFRMVHESTNATNGGSRRFLFQKKSEHTEYIVSDVGKVLDMQRRQFLQLSTFVDELREGVQTALLSKQHHGLGASTKGNTLLQLLGINHTLIPYVAEINPDKFGTLTPGTNIPIISEVESREKCPEGYFVLPWHFREHFVSRADLKDSFTLTFPLPSLVSIPPK